MDSRLTGSRRVAEEVREINTHGGCGSVRHTRRISEKRCGGLTDSRIPKRNNHGRAGLDEMWEGADDTGRPFSHLANYLWGGGICAVIFVCVKERIHQRLACSGVICWADRTCCWISANSRCCCIAVLASKSSAADSSYYCMSNGNVEFAKVSVKSTGLSFQPAVTYF